MHWHALTILTRHWLWQHSFIASHGVEFPVVSKCSSWTFICIAAYPFAEWTSTAYLDRIWNLGAHSTRCSFIPYGIAIHNVSWHFGDACMVPYRPYVMVAHRQSQWSQFWWWSAQWWCNASTSTGWEWQQLDPVSPGFWSSTNLTGPELNLEQDLVRAVSCADENYSACCVECRETPQGWWMGSLISDFGLSSCHVNWD